MQILELAVMFAADAKLGRVEGLTRYCSVFPHASNR